MPNLGRPFVVPTRRHEFYGLVHQILPLTAAGIRQADSVQIDGQADLLIYAQAGLYGDGQFKATFQLTPERYMEDVPTFISGLVGTGSFAQVLPAPLRIPRASTFTMWVDDRTVVAPTSFNIRVLHIGLKEFDRPFQSAAMYTDVRPFRYVANFTVNDGGAGRITANGTAQFANIISSEHDFQIHKVSIIADGGATMNVEISGKALSWFNRACHISLLGATDPNAAVPSGAWPFRLPRPVFVPNSSAILTTVNDLGEIVPAASNRVQVIYHGLRLYPPGGLPVSSSLADRLQSQGGMP